MMQILACVSPLLRTSGCFFYFKGGYGNDYLLAQSIKLSVPLADTAYLCAAGLPLKNASWGLGQTVPKDGM
jgi:hypothetical protein